MLKSLNILLLFLTGIISANSQPLVTNDGLALTFQVGLTATIKGAFTNQTNGANKGTIDNAGTITLTGNWSNNSANTVFSTASGTVHLLGTAAQSITGSNSTGFNNLTINNTSATGVTLAKPATVAGALTLTDGYVYTDAVNVLTLNDNATSSSGSAASFVEGPIKKIGDDAFVFPTGNDIAPAGFGAEDVWARIGISAPATATTEFTARYHFIPYSDLTVDATLDHVSTKEYWDLDRAVNADNVNVTVYFESAVRSGITDLVGSDLRVARYNGVDFVDNGQAAISGTDPGNVTSTLVSSFNVPFTFGSKTGVNPLPVEFLYFAAKPNKNVVNVNWSTAVEFNNAYFIVQHSQDGKTFQDFAKVAGGGNSSMVQKYSAIDYEPFDGISYYRLKQVDNDGKYSHSNIVAVNRNSNDAILIYPNPATGPFNIVISGQNGRETLIVIRDLLGKEFYSKLLILSGDKEVIAMDPTGTLAAGVYFVVATSDNNIFEKKVIIK